MHNNNWIINNYQLSNNEQKVAYFGVGFLAVIIFFILIMFGVYIYYSWIRKTNTANLTGRTLTEKLFQQNNKNVAVVDSYFYAKYWNYNKKRGTHKLRPWTSNRSSIWTMMEASQQAYATIIRDTKGKQFWWLFRLPFIIRLLGVILGIGIIAIGLSKTSDSEHLTFRNVNIPSFITGIIVITICYLIADVGKIYLLWKNITPLIAKSGLAEDEIRDIKRIFFWRMILAIAIVILEIAKLIIKIAIESKKATQKK